MRRSGVAFAAALVGLAYAAAPAAQPPQPPTFRSEASLVRVDVAVVDHDGEPVTTLASDDFEVVEDGIPQTVQSFKFVSADGRPPAGEDVSLAIRSPEHAAAEAARDDVRVFLIFWDEYHIGRFVDAIQGRKALTDFVTSAFGPTDLVALMDPLLPVSALRFTRDRAELAARIQKLEGRFGVYVPTRSAAEDAQTGRRDIARVRSEVTLSAMQSAAVHLGSLKEGRKAIVFVTEGLPGLGYDESSLVQEMTAAANTNNVAVYTLDPRGLNAYDSGQLRTISANTGGQAFVSTNTPARALRQVVRDASAFYLLGYASTRNPTDGKYHTIKVRVKRSRVDVLARKGYWAPKLADMERARAEAAAADAVPADVTSAWAVLSTARAGRTLDVWTGAARGADRQPEVTVAWTPFDGAQGRPRSQPAQPGQAAGGGRTVAITARGPGGERMFDAPLDAGRLTFAAAPGLLNLQVTLRDAAGDTIEEYTRSIVVPDLSTPGLALSSPVVVRARNVWDARTIAGAADAAPFAGSEFVRTDRVFVRFAVYGASASEAVASAHLLSRTGSPLVKLPVTANAAVETAYQIELPLASTARGDFLIAIEAEHGTEKARVLVPIRVVP